MDALKISERFLSVQGEGLHAGRRAYFIRLFGCPVRCPWCDTKYAWAGSPAERLGAERLAADAAASGAEIAVITGGEPCAQNLAPLLEALAKRNVAAHLETSGVLPISETDSARFEWVAASPKLFAPPLAESLARADELKFIISDPAEIPLYAPLAEAAPRAKAVWLNPEWGKSADKNLLAAICGFVQSEGGRFRAGWQLHKCYFAR